jgi:KR domain
MVLTFLNCHMSTLPQLPGAVISQQSHGLRLTHDDRYLNRLIDGYKNGVIIPVKPITVFEAENVHEAFRFMQKGQHIGKTVIKFPKNPDDLPMVPVSEQLVFKSDVSYFLPGGLGGLGQAIAVWMAIHGARHLIFLSRSGAENVDNAFFDELKQMGCTTQVFVGDVSKLEDVKQAVSQAQKPIAGVMQMTMVIRVYSNQMACPNLANDHL